MDIDIGVIVDDLNTKTEVQDTLLEAGCTLKKEYIFQGNIVEQSYLLKDIKFDVGFYENTENNSICYLFYNESTIQLPPNKLNTVKMTYSKISEFRKQRFYNTDVIIPKNPEKLLEEKYGSTWMKPNENWVYWQAPNAEYLDELGEVVIY